MPWFKLNPLRWLVLIMTSGYPCRKCWRPQVGITVYCRRHVDEIMQREVVGQSVSGMGENGDGAWHHLPTSALQIFEKMNTQELRSSLQQSRCGKKVYPPTIKEGRVTCVNCLRS